MEGDLTDLDRFGIEPKLRSLLITAVTHDHIEQSFAVAFADDTIRFAGKKLAASLAAIDENTHAEFVGARNMP